VYAVDETSAIQEEVEEGRVHTNYIKLLQSPTERIYFDVGIVKVCGKLTRIVPLGRTAELTQLEAGLPVGCLGFGHNAQKISRFDKFQPQLACGRVFLITLHPNLPECPRLIHVKAEVPTNAFGSPVVNMEGRIVGVYAESPTPESRVENLHYAVALNSDLFPSNQDWFASETWVPPLTPGEGTPNVEATTEP
jgi:hypothetical protein